VHAGGLQDLLDLFGLSGLVVMISQHADHWDRARAQIVRENFRFTRLADIREIAAKDEHFRLGRDFRKQFSEQRSTIFPDVGR
jgi:hypothetical protein